MKTVSLELEDNESIYAAFIRLSSGQLGFVSGFAKSGDEFVSNVQEARIGQVLVVQNVLEAIDVCVVYEHIQAPLDNDKWRRIM